MSDAAARRAIPALFAVGVCVAALWFLLTPTVARAQGHFSENASAAATGPASIERGAVTYSQKCSTCHLADASGQGERGIPSLQRVGAASVDFYLSTGRMPAANNAAQAPRKPVTVSVDDRADLVAYITNRWPGGPAIPTFPLSGDISDGGALFRANCAACHGAVGAGGALAYGAFAPSLRSATSLQVAEAMRVGPGNMPVFDAATLSDAQTASMVTYVKYLQNPDNRGGAGLGYTGPVGEGFVGLLLAVGGAMAIATWVGQRAHEEPKEHSDG